MRQFRKNVLRLAMQNKGAFIGAVLIIAIGIFIYVAMMDTLKNLEGQIEAYYEEAALADIFAEVSGIPEAELARLEDIAGIARASGRMAEDVRLLGAGQEELVTVHLLSYDPEDPLNKLTLSGSAPESGSLYLGSRMAEVYGYSVGEPLTVLWKGESWEHTFSGICHEPEYVYAIPPGGAMIPDGEVYDIACVERSRMEEITSRQDSLNELGFSLSPGYTYEDVRHELMEGLRPWGLISLVEKKDQGSVNMVDGEIGELISIGTILPMIFMAISIFMLYVVLKKMIDRDQNLIGTMKAFGLTDRELVSAYLFEGAAAGLLGALLGSLLAIPFGQYMFDMYVDFFNLPDTVYHSYPGSRLAGLAIAVLTGFLAVWLGVREILSIAPAQAMRAKAPGEFGNVPLPKSLRKRLDAVGKMGFRSAVRNPFRGFLIVLAIAFPFSMASTLLSFDDVAEQMFLNQFEKIQVYDLQASLDRYVSPVKALESGEFLPGVKAAEAVCTVPVEFKRDNRSEFAMLYGLNPGSQLWKIMDNEGTFYEPSEKGVILNSRTAAKLRVSSGDLVEISCQGFQAEPVLVPVVQVIEESFGSGCYMALSGFGSLFQAEPASNTVLLSVEDGRLAEVKERLRETSRVAWLVDAKKIVGSYRNMMQSMIMMIGMFSVFSVVAGGILIYNISMINIRERVTELGTILVLGGFEREIGRMMLMEQAVYFVLGILFGIPGSQAIRILIETLVLSESYTVHIRVQPGSYLAAFLLCLGITCLTCAAQVRFVSRISLTDILKEREA